MGILLIKILLSWLIYKGSLKVIRHSRENGNLKA